MPWYLVSPLSAQVLPLDEALAHKIQTVDDLPKALPVYQNLKPVLGRNSILTLEGERWYRLRKMFNPAFSQAHLETLVPGIAEEVLVFVETLKRAAAVGDTLLMLDQLIVSHSRTLLT